MANRMEGVALRVCRNLNDGVLHSFRGALLLYVLIFAIPGFGQQSGTPSQVTSALISGKVTAVTGENTTNDLAGIIVKLTGPAPASTLQTTLSDSEGYYEFTHLAPGNYTLEATDEGFKPWTGAVSLVAGQTATENIALQLTSVEEQVEVQGEATEVATQSTSPTATVSEQQLQSLPLRTGKFTEALSVSPGVIRTQEGKLNINGQAESQGMLLVDSAENVDPVSGSFAIPIPVDAIQSIQVFNTPDSSAYGGFSGGLTKIEIRPPGPTWNYKLLDLVPSFRGKNDHLVGIANIAPRVEVGGPLIANKLNFSEDLTYEFRRDPVHGLTWPFNETYTYSLVSFTEAQYTFSPKHLLNANLNIFPSTNLYANINTLIPQSASSNFRRRGVSLGISDGYQFESGKLLTTVVRYTNFYTNEHGQGSTEMTINPEGWGGNFFNAYWRNANQLEAIPILQMPTKTWLGRHETQFGMDVLYRSYTGSSVSQPIQLLAQDGTLAETINFHGLGRLQGADTEVSEYGEDHWTMNDHLSVTFGGRLTSQSIGRDVAIAPRAGLAYSMAHGKIVARAGAGLIYGHVPLLAADFADNQEREITSSSGPLSGEPITLQNVYRFSGSGTNFSSLTDPNSSPRTLTWNFETDVTLRNNVDLRIGYFETHTVNLFVVDPILPVTGTTGFLALEDTGSSHYRQAQLIARYRPSERAELNLSYTWSRARGDLNTLSEAFIPVPVPVIRPNTYGVESSDVPNRVIAWGYLTLPWKLVISPVADIHSGFPYSNLDVQQNYVGTPNSLRFPAYFSLDVKIYRTFSVRIPFGDRKKRRKIRVGVYSLDVTNRQNPHDVFNNVASSLFGQFAGFQRRFTGLAIDLGQ
jgi:Carboxypeptidase regulatory-like domain/TonB-dependent Receptor Plug Domain